MTPRVASYVSGSGTTELLFEYTLLEPDWENNTMLVPSNSLALNGGTVRSSAGIDAWLKHERGTRGIHEACRPAPDGPRLLVGSIEGSQMDSRLWLSSQQSAAAIVHGRRGRHAARVEGAGDQLQVHHDGLHPLRQLRCAGRRARQRLQGRVYLDLRPGHLRRPGVERGRHLLGGGGESRRPQRHLAHVRERHVRVVARRPDADQDGQWVVERRLVRPRDAHRDLRHHRRHRHHFPSPAVRSAGPGRQSGGH